MRYGPRLRHTSYDAVLKIPAATSGKVAIEHDDKPEDTTLVTGTLRTLFFGQPQERLYFPHATRWHRLVEKDYGTWMTDLPIEQRQMDALIRPAKGHVLVGGLGLGYAVVALAVKRSVKQIVVVERSADIIKLVWEPTVARVHHWCALAHVPVPKLAVVHADLFKYLRKRQKDGLGLLGLYDWALFDIWQGDGEITFHRKVVPLRKLAHGIVTEVACWNEDIMRAQLLNGLRSRIEMMGHPTLSSMVKLSDLSATKGQSIYTRWAVPFWRWYRDDGQQRSVAEVMTYATEYVRSYGMQPSAPRPRRIR